MSWPQKRYHPWVAVNKRRTPRHHRKMGVERNLSPRHRVRPSVAKDPTRLRNRSRRLDHRPRLGLKPAAPALSLKKAALHCPENQRKPRALARAPPRPENLTKPRALARALQ